MTHLSARILSGAQPCADYRGGHIRHTGQAQQAIQGPDYAAWEKTATRAEVATERRARFLAGA